MIRILPLIGLLLLSGIAAMWADRPASSLEQDQVEVWDLGNGEIEQISYETPEVSVEISILRGKKTLYWAKLKKIQPLSEAEFLLSNRFEDYLKKFKPLIANRVFKQQDAAKLKEFGFDDKIRHFTVKTSQKVLELETGSKGFGGEFVYAHISGKADIWLLSRDMLDDIENLDARFFEKSFLFSAVDDIKSVEFNSLGKSKDDRKKIFHKGKDSDGTLGWQGTEEGQQLAGFKNWFDRFARLRVVAYAASKDLQNVHAKLGEKILDVNVEWTSKTEKLEFFATSENPDSIYIKSSLLNVMPRISRAKIQPLVDEYVKILNL